MRALSAVTSIIQQVGQLGGRLVLGVLAVPPAHLEQTAPTAPGHEPTSYAATGRWFGS